MKIDMTSPMSVSGLLAALAGADPNETVEFVRTPKRERTVQCWCGCGQTTKSRFVPGHDARFHGLAKRVARGEAAMPETFVNDEARADFLAHVERERPLHAAREQERARARAIKEAARLEREASREERRTGRVVEMVEIDEETAALLAEIG